MLNVVFVKRVAFLVQHISTLDMSNGVSWSGIECFSVGYGGMFRI
jgi:hypothetical protein